MNKAEVAELKDYIKREKPKLGELVPPKPKVYAPRKLDIACGRRKEPGYKGIDMAGDADIIHDLFTYPWPIKSNACTHIMISHFAEHIPHYRPEYGGIDGWWVFWREVYRICKDKAEVKVIHPYLWNERAFQDPTHTRFLGLVTWYYLDKNIREVSELDHYMPAEVDFEMVVANAQGLPDDVMLRNEETKAQIMGRNINIVSDMHVTLKARKSP